MSTLVELLDEISRAETFELEEANKAIVTELRYRFKKAKQVKAARVRVGQTGRLTDLGGKARFLNGALGTVERLSSSSGRCYFRPESPSQMGWYLRSDGTVKVPRSSFQPLDGQEA